ncbi:hypothetical protein EON63_25425, partial [archaeon]
MDTGTFHMLNIQLTSCTIFTPYTLLSTLCTIYHIPYTIPHNIHHAPCSVHHTRLSRCQILEEDLKNRGEENKKIGGRVK